MGGYDPACPCYKCRQKTEDRALREVERAEDQLRVQVLRRPDGYFEFDDRLYVTESAAVADRDFREKALAKPANWKTRVAAQFDELAGEAKTVRNTRTVAAPERKTPAPSTPTSTEEVQVSYDRIVQNADAAVKAEIAKRETERITAEKIALVDAYGEDGFADGTVIRFNKKHNKAGVAYVYTAVRYTAYDETNWLTSCKDDSSANRTWGGLVEFLVSGPFPTTSFEIMTAASTYPASAPAEVAKADKA